MPEGMIEGQTIRATLPASAIATNSMTAGAVLLYLDWIPVSAGATVVSGS